MDVKMYIKILFLVYFYQCLFTSCHGLFQTQQRLFPRKRTMSYIYLYRQPTTRTTLHKRFFEFNPLAFELKNSLVEGHRKRFFHFSPFTSRHRPENRVVPAKESPKLFGSGYIINGKAPEGLKPYVDHFSGVRSFALHLFRPKKKPRESRVVKSINRKEREILDRFQPKLLSDIEDNKSFESPKYFPGITTRTFNIGHHNYLRSAAPKLNLAGLKDFVHLGLDEEKKQLLEGNQGFVKNSLPRQETGSDLGFKSSILNGNKQDTLEKSNNDQSFHGWGYLDSLKPDLDYSSNGMSPDAGGWGSFDVPTIQTPSDNIGFGSFKPDDSLETINTFDDLYGEDLDNGNNGFGSFGSFSSNSVSISKCLVKYRLKLIPSHFHLHFHL